MAAIFALAYIGQLLDVTTRRELIPDQHSRKAHRAAECSMPDARKVSFHISSEHSDHCHVTQIRLRRINYLFLQQRRVVPNARKKSKAGELCHYFDRIWVVSGTNLERYVCFQGENLDSFMVLRHYANSRDAHDLYDDFLDDLEERWYGMKEAETGG